MKRQASELEQAVLAGLAQVEQVCQTILAQHASTHERLPILEAFLPSEYLNFTGKPDIILDLACGLNPLALPWMGLPATVQYHAYDLHQPRVKMINRFFELMGLAPLAEVRDILLSPPEIEAPVAFFFKEAHRFEQRQHGCNVAFWNALRVRYLLVSLPTSQPGWPPEFARTPAKIGVRYNWGCTLESNRNDVRERTGFLHR